MPASEHTVYVALLTDAEAKIVSWNRGCEKMFGLAAGKVLHTPLGDLLAEQSRAVCVHRESEAPALCDSVAVHYRGPDGELHEADLTLVPQQGEDGRRTHCVAFFMTTDDYSESAVVGRMPLSSVIDVLPGIFYVIREDGSHVLWNRQLETVTGLLHDEVPKTSCLELFDLTDKRIVRAKIDEVFHENAQVFVETNYLDRLGHGTPYLLCGAQISCRGRLYLCGMGIDISERRRQEEVLRLRERALHATSNGLVITRCAGNENPIEYVNPAFERITGYGAEEVLGRDSRFMAAAGLDDDEREQLRRAIRERREVNVVFRNRRKNGEIFWNDLTITPVSDGRGKVTHFIGVINDVTALKQRTAHLEHEVNHDALTGLANRTLLWDRLEQAIHMAQRNKTMVATVLMDLNGFKQINDTHGHEAGDEVLKAVAGRLASSVRESDTVARLSGDEFVLVLVNQPSLRYTMRMIERLRQAMVAPVAFDASEIGVGASIGVSVYPHDGSGALDLVRAADVAMYHAKVSKTGEAHFFSPDMKSTTDAKQKLEDDLRGAIDRDELFLLFQPKICLRTGRVAGLEALLRWRHPEQGILAPPSFLPEAEENGVVIQIGEYVLEQVCHFIRRMCDAHMAQLPIAVNVSYREFSRQDFVQSVACMLSRCKLAPDSLELELREDGLNANQHLAVDVVSQLRELGVRRSIDAFGDGMSDLNFLQKLPLTHVKLAKVAVHQISAQARSGVVAKALIDVGHDLGVQVIAKGVESQVQVEFLKLNGCDEMQGVYFSEPLPETAVHGLLAMTMAP